ncbi:MAG: aspartate/glutamate racemase family protein [Proteobacteria bacterium]|nr:aspartate/glutamate racemase family protein [Pseudomonadota bacterium]MBU4577129.1 aspartate/glutamate racemase family protein [Pseudomonadota bacterium]MBV1717024.1 aspartate/glutamate racemase family protein [Desulfarculus sp.]
MKKKILIQRIAASDPQAAGTKIYGDLLMKNAGMVKEDDTEITLRLLKRGLNSLNEFAFSHLHYLNDREVFEAVLQGERDGFDAVIVYCFSDPALDEMRQAINIPVIGLGQSSMMLASLMGAKFGLIGMSPASLARNEQLARRYGMADKIILPIKPLPVSLEDQGKMIMDVNAGLKGFEQVASYYLDQGAEVLVPACGSLNLALRFCPGAPDRPEGITQYQGMPIVDCLSAAIKMAEMMITLRQAGSPWISRKGIYSQPTEDVTRGALEKMAYSFGGTI